MAVIDESVDPQAFLTPPAEPAENFADSLRWNAGPLLGGMDWLAEKIIHFSFIAELVEPVSGDWVGLERGVQAWQSAADASSAVAQNYAVAAQGVATAWAGDAAEAAIARMQSVSEGFMDYADGCSAMSEVTASLLDLCKAAAETIAGILGFAGDYLTRLAMEASVPVVGWATGAIDGAVSGALLLGKLEKGYEVLQKVLNFVERFTDVIALIQRISYVITLTANSLRYNQDIGTAGIAGDATAAAFGVE